ncbi:MAG: ribose-5-phosphate isomerase RpiA [Candidatus Eremiobacteraeota bacterium]|nr:ribose-5-phosphate isomerase RpiA [Candidatus Eremiobacteraeota bacterium]
MSGSAVDEEKRAAGYAAVDRFVHRGMRCIGLGTGSTAFWAIDRLGARVAEGWELVAVATSVETERLCEERGIRTVGLLEGPPIEVAIDGADEVAPDFALTKGGGGALFREKAVALAAKKFVVVVGENKLVRRLGKFPLPVEVVPFSARYVERELRLMCPSVELRMRAGAPFVTDNGNYILDCAFGEIPAPGELDHGLRAIHGVVATGLFVNLAAHVLVGSPSGVSELERASSKTNLPL